MVPRIRVSYQFMSVTLSPRGEMPALKAGAGNSCSVAWQTALGTEDLSNDHLRFGLLACQRGPCHQAQDSHEYCGTCMTERGRH
jgi:hypothetical protein